MNTLGKITACAALVSVALGGLIVSSDAFKRGYNKGRLGNVTVEQRTKVANIITGCTVVRNLGMTGEISKMCGGKSVKIDILEIKQPELDAQLISESVATQLERRISFRRAMKRAVQTAMEMGAEGIRIRCAGRLGGADIARAEWYRQGKVPLQTLRVAIDYAPAFRVSRRLLRAAVTAVANRWASALTVRPPKSVSR